MDPKEVEIIVDKLKKACEKAGDGSEVFLPGGIDSLIPPVACSLIPPRDEAVRNKPGLLCGQQFLPFAGSCSAQLHERLN